VWYPPSLISVLPVVLRRKRIRPECGNIGENPKENIIQVAEITKESRLSTPVEKHVGNYFAYRPEMNVFPILSHP
jgi:hypothetical protein